MKKKIIASALAVCMMATLAIGMTLAYFTDTKSADNVFTVGNVKIELAEPNWDKEGGGKADADAVYAGEALAKDPTITNTGANPCFVRIKVAGLDSLVPEGTTDPALMIKYRTGYIDNVLGDGWVLHTDGYYYYSTVLPERATTDSLFDQIVMPAALENGNTDAEYKVIVSAQAVQAQGAKASFSDVQMMTLPEIQAWFTTCGMDTP